MRYAAIDIGSNSVLLNISEKDKKGKWKSLFDISEITRLGEGLSDSLILNQVAVNRTINVILKMKKKIEEFGVYDFCAVGTMALRNAKNAKEFIGEVKNECKIDIDVISGEEEARLTHLGVVAGFDITSGNVLIFDVGGGSTEFIFSRNRKIKNLVSLNVGTIKYNEKYLVSNPVSNKEYTETCEIVKRDLKTLGDKLKNHFTIGVGGTITNLAAIKHNLKSYDPGIIHGSVLTAGELEKIIFLLKSKTIEERKNITGLEPKRADVILSGAVIIKEILKAANTDFLTVSDRGLRHGILIDRFSDKKIC